MSLASIKNILRQSGAEYTLFNMIILGGAWSHTTISVVDPSDESSVGGLKSVGGIRKS